MIAMHTLFKTCMNMTTPNELSLCAWNVRGFDIAIPYLRYLLDRYDIVCVSEHWLYKNQHMRFGEVANDVDFICQSSIRSPAESYGSGRGQGGVGIFWKKHLGGVTVVKDVSHDRFCAIRLQNQQGTIFNIFSVYLSSAGSDDDLAATLDELEADSY